MADYEMTIESGPRPSLSYLMPPGSEPEYFEVYIPQITTDAGEKAFKSDILTVIGLSICRRDGLSLIHIYGYVRNRNDGMTEYTIVGLGEVEFVLKLLQPFLHLKKALACLLYTSRCV